MTIALLCFLLSCIAVLQVGLSKGIQGSPNAGLNLNSTFQKRTPDTTYSTATGVLLASTSYSGAYLASTSTSGTPDLPTVTNGAYLSTPTGSGTSATSPGAYLSPSMVHTSTSSPPSFLIESSPFATKPYVLVTTVPSSVDPSVIATPTTDAYLGPSGTISGAYLSTGVVSIGSYILRPTEVAVPGDFNTSRYFIATYVPTLVAVVLKSTWDVIYAAAKMMEPFYQLSHPHGAPATASLLACYFQTSFSWNSFQTIARHPAMLFAGAVYSIISMIAPFASESSTIKVTNYCPRPQDPTLLHPCNAAWILNATAIRVLQALLSLTFIFVMIFMILNWKRTSGIYSDPSSIASVASLLGNADVRADFARIDPMAREKDMKTALSGNSYALSHYQFGPDEYHYGIVKVNSPNHNPASFGLGSITPSTKAGSPVRRKLLEDILLTSLDVGLLVVIVYYYLDTKNDAFNRFFNSQSFGPRFLLTIIATIIDTMWKRVEKECRIIQPYRELAKSKSSGPDNTILATRTTTPIAAVFHSLVRGNLFQTMVALMSSLSGILMIAIPGVPFQETQLYIAFLVSIYVSIGILGLMVITNIGVFFWRRGNPAMPRNPDTLANIASYLCSSHMIPEMSKLSTISQTGLNQSIKLGGHKYWFARGIGMDERVRWMIDDDQELNRLKPSDYK